MKILITEPEYFPEQSLTLLKELGEVTTKKFSRKELLENIEKFDIIIVRIDTRIDKEVMEKAKRLKIIASVTTGTNHIDVAHAESKGIKIINLLGTNANAAAEYTFGLMLSLLRNIPQSSESIKQGEWKRGEFVGYELKDKVLGIIGLGRIGSRIAHFANAFDMRVYAYDKYIDAYSADKLGVSMMDIDSLLMKSDIITLNCVLTDETRNMISYDQFKLMKKTSFLINTSRGEVLDEEALLDALKTGKISGAALDVLAEESRIIENSKQETSQKLIDYAKTHRNLIITPHLGGSTKEAVSDSTLFIVNKIKEHLKENKK